MPLILSPLVLLSSILAAAVLVILVPHSFLLVPFITIGMLFTGMIVEFLLQLQLSSIVMRWKVKQLEFTEFRLLEERYVDRNGETRINLIRQKRTRWPLGFEFWHQDKYSEAEVWTESDGTHSARALDLKVAKDSLASERHSLIEQIYRLNANIGKKQHKVIA